MKIINLKKTKREIRRVFRNIFEAPYAFFDQMFATFYYDHFLAKKIVFFIGDLPISEKCAIYLVFSPDGLTRGHLESLKYLISENYSPIVVSNAPLSAEELDMVRPMSYQVIIRPNFGYDFGGYRDGILTLYSNRHKINRIALLNDSCWFPLPNSFSWLSFAEALNVDFTSALTHAGPNWYEVVLKSNNSSKNLTKHRKFFHYCSFALLFSKGAIQRSDFWNFWKNLKISSSKDRTVRFGERALSTFMFQNSFTHQPMISEDLIASTLTDLPSCNHTKEVQNFLKNGGWPAYSLREYLYISFGFMFMKKRFNGDFITTEDPFLSNVLKIISLPLTDRKSTPPSRRGH